MSHFQNDCSSSEVKLLGKFPECFLKKIKSTDGKWHHSTHSVHSQQITWSLSNLCLYLWNIRNGSSTLSKVKSGYFSCVRFSVRQNCKCYKDDGYICESGHFWKRLSTSKAGLQCHDWSNSQRYKCKLGILYWEMHIVKLGRHSCIYKIHWST